MSNPSDHEVRRLDQQLLSAQRAELRWNRFADDFEAQALDIRRVARQLADHNAPLRREVEPIRHLHIAETWEGDAATDSRRRLDTIEDRLFATARNIDHVIDDLTTRAGVIDRSADDARDNVRTARRRAAQLQRELGVLDDVYL